MEDRNMLLLIEALELYMANKPDEEKLREFIQRYLISIRGYINEDECRIWDITRGLAYVICSAFDIKYKKIETTYWE